MWSCCVFILFVDVLHFIFLLFVHVFSSHFLFDIIPHPLVGYRQVYTHFILTAQPTTERFATLLSSTIPRSSSREHYSEHFLPTCFSPYAPLPTFFTQPAFINASLGAGSSSLKFAGPPTEVRNTEQIQPTCLFESYSVQQKLRVSRFYLSIMATRVCEESVPSW